MLCFLSWKIHTYWIMRTFEKKTQKTTIFPSTSSPSLGCFIVVLSHECFEQRPNHRSVVKLKWKPFSGLHNASRNMEVSAYKFQTFLLFTTVISGSAWWKGAKPITPTSIWIDGQGGEKILAKRWNDDLVSGHRTYAGQTPRRRHKTT